MIFRQIELVRKGWKSQGKHLEAEKIKTVTNPEWQKSVYEPQLNAFSAASKNKHFQPSCERKSSHLKFEKTVTQKDGKRMD